jgi:hypothetical protein
MHCSNCGTALATGTSFCANCGTPATPSAPPAAPQYAPQPVPQPVPASNYAYSQQPAAPTEGLAIASLIVSLATLLFTGGIFSFVGAILGHIALSNIKKSGKGGRGMAIAGIAIGWAVTAFWIIAAVIIFGVAAGSYNFYNNY